MAIVTPADLLRQLSLTADAPADDLALVEGKIAAAQNHIERLLGFRIEEVFGGADQDPVPPVLKEAVMQLASWWFENREAATDISRILPFGVQEIVNEYREWSF
ncbi:phage gp6-like head-tail connector protein [Sinirhodobacter populi]|uniref:Phage gp6-like head-tail connector protein n=1 Tax=Paenirhodobacter populi TaxID=2306993 RepID=A0A443K9U9_9RHOB|nr:head-tail connector protein [Sinirhodobacter populi]RWR29462.1 phage gp6-like head-tail connector protein [Sinirhodobacter populi]